MVILSTALFAAAICGASSSAHDASASRAFSSLTFSFVRKQLYQNQVRIAQGHFYYDAQFKSVCYDYSGAFHYRFIVSDTAVLGLDTKKNSGYKIVRSADSARYNDVYESVNLLGQFLQGIAIANSVDKCTIRASIDSMVYMESHREGVTDVAAIIREKNMPIVIESFDQSGRMFEQTKVAYDTKRRQRPAPSCIVVRKKIKDITTVDSLIISAVEVDKAISPDIFKAPHGCAMRAFGDHENSALPFFKPRE